MALAVSEPPPKLSRKIRKQEFSAKPEKPVTPLTAMKENSADSTGVSKAILQIFQKHNYDPLEELVALRCMRTVLIDAKTGEPVIDAKTGQPAVVPFLDPREAVAIDKELLKYLYPQKKAVEIAAKAGEGGVVILSLTDTIERLALESKNGEADAEDPDANP